MAKLEDNSDNALTLTQLHNEVLKTLQAASIDDSEVSARRILEETTGVDVAQFPAEGDQLVTHRAVARTDALTARRVNGEPLQYVIGSWNFRHLDLAVAPRALIPRPETEIVVGCAVDLLTSNDNDIAENPIVVDLGTGPGAIALSIAQEVPNAQVHATDVSEEALALASSNLAGLGGSAARVQLHNGDWFRALPLMSQRAISPADMARVRSPPGPDPLVVCRKPCITDSISIGSSPSARPHSVSTMEPKADAKGLSPRPGAKVTPMPSIPSSVIILRVTKARIPPA